MVVKELQTRGQAARSHAQWKGHQIQPRALMLVWALTSVDSFVRLWSNSPFREVKCFLYSTDPTPVPFLLWPPFQRQLRQFIGMCKINQNSKRDNRQKIRGNLLFWNECQKAWHTARSWSQIYSKCPHVNEGTMMWARLSFIPQPKMPWRASGTLRQHECSMRDCHEVRRHTWNQESYTYTILSKGRNIFKSSLHKGMFESYTVKR